MNDTQTLDLVRKVRAGDEQAAAELFGRYAHRLIALAQVRLSKKLARRVDPEDIVQSVCRSFLLRARDGQYSLDESGDLWRLLCKITINKVCRQARHHGAAKRDVDAEASLSESLMGISPETLSREPSPEDASILPITT